MPNKRHLAVIRHYKKLKAANPDTWKSYTANQQSLQSAIRAAALCRDATGRKHPHQYRLVNNTLRAYSNVILNNIKKVELITTFDDLYKLLYQLKIHGIGALTVYDISVRLGEYLGFEPQKIYLHAGTRVGVEKLVGNVIGDTIRKNQLPIDFSVSNLSCYELEDLMCIYKYILK